MCAARPSHRPLSRPFFNRLSNVFHGFYDSLLLLPLHRFIDRSVFTYGKHYRILSYIHNISSFSPRYPRAVPKPLIFILLVLLFLLVFNFFPPLAPCFSFPLLLCSSRGTISRCFCRSHDKYTVRAKIFRTLANLACREG